MTRWLLLQILFYTRLSRYFLRNGGWEREGSQWRKNNTGFTSLQTGMTEKEAIKAEIIYRMWGQKGVNQA